MLTFRPIIPGQQLTGSIATIYTAAAPVAGSVILAVVIQRFVLSNTTGSDIVVSLYRVASGGAAGAANEIFPAQTIKAGTSQSVSVMEGLSLLPGDFIAAIGLNCTVEASGVIVS